MIPIHIFSKLWNIGIIICSSSKIQPLYKSPELSIILTSYPKIPHAYITSPPWGIKKQPRSLILIAHDNTIFALCLIKVLNCHKLSCLHYSTLQNFFLGHRLGNSLANIIFFFDILRISPF